MGTSAHEDDPMLRLRYYRETGQADEATHYERYLRETGQFADEEKPGVVSRGLSALGAGLSNMVHHPIDFATSLISAPVESAANIAAPSIEGAARYNADPMAQARNVARFGGEIHAQGVTGKERAAGIAQTAANLLTPGIYGGAKKLLAPAVGKTLATGAGLAASGAATGAAYSPDDPAAGAVAGGIAAPIVGGVISGVARGGAKVRGGVRTVQRVRNAPTLGASAQTIDANIENATRANYGKAEQEGVAAGGTSPGLAKALEHPRVKKYVDMVRGEEGSSMSDAAVARKVYTLMSKQRRGLKSAMEVNGYDAAKDLEAGRLGDAMKLLKDATATASERPPVTYDIPAETFEKNPVIEPGREALRGPTGSAPLRANTTPPANPTLRQALRDFPESSHPTAMQGPGGPAFQMAAKPDRVTPGVRIETPGMRVQTAPAEEVPPVMPSFPRAIGEKARMEGERTAFNTAADATRRVMKGASIAGKRQLAQSPEAFSKALSEMTPGEAQEALAGILGRAKEGLSLRNANPTHTLFGAISSVRQPITNLRRVAPFIEQADRAAGNPVPAPMDLENILKLLGIPVGSSIPPQP